MATIMCRKPKSCHALYSVVFLLITVLGTKNVPENVPNQRLRTKNVPENVPERDSRDKKMSLNEQWGHLLKVKTNRELINEYESLRYLHKRAWD